ncbi:hypothetical protein N007_05550 [Alicyclobacillus acidoterrestris ATCC 49025]|nr:hypothetical protein N007_05550 [Alicyclobacillus acidoterrestris ATCC 49025]
MKWFKRCDHEYYKVLEVDVYDGYANHVRTDYYIYCPKCDKRRKVKPYQWEVIEREQKIKSDYINNRH